ncbi:MAG: hypothetical protein OEW09_04770 [Anaerolineae bacterium]|nr:hypothetical protein [Anaerolineae bacterium]
MAEDRATVYFTDSTIRVLEFWKDRGWDVKDVVNAGIILFHGGGAEGRENAMALANLPDGKIGVQMPDSEFEQRVLAILRQYDRDAMRAAGEAVVEQAAAEARAEGRRGKRARKTG